MPVLEEFIIFISLFGISLFSFRGQSSDAQNVLLVVLFVCLFLRKTLK